MEHLPGDGIAAMQCTDAGRLGHLYLVETDLRALATVHGTVGHPLHPRCIGIHQKQAEAILITGLAGGTRQHHQQVRLVAVHHAALGAIQYRLIAIQVGDHGGVFQRKHPLILFRSKGHL